MFSYGASMSPMAFNPNKRKRQEIMSYYQQVSAMNKGQEAAVVPITLSWQVNAYVKEKEAFFRRCCKRFRRRDGKEPTVKHILKNVSGVVKPGQLCAIMGASGAGKTTLLNVLNFRNKNKMVIGGDIKINGKTVDWKEITECSGYVQQEDLFMGTLTVKEHLTFLAMMKLDRRMTKAEKLERVEEIMLQMNLLHIQDTYIGEGDRLRGISGGEKRRLAFASEVLNNPQLLFCDEPTSGLDSFMAESIINAMKLVSSQGKTVLSTIHQPSSQVFEKFDVLCLLGEGRVVFFGPTKEAAQFFQSIGKPCPRLYNPADHYIQTVAIFPNLREQCLRNVNMICDTFEKSQYKRNLLQSMLVSSSPFQHQHSVIEKKQRYNASYSTQIRWLLWRQNLNSYRNPMAASIMAVLTIIVSLMFGLIYLQLENNQEGVQNRIGVLFILLIEVGFGFLFPVIAMFPLELQVFYREVKNRVYPVLPYYVAKQVAELPKFIILPFLMVTITYWMANILNDGKVFIAITSIFILASLVSLGAGTVIAILAPNAQASVALSAPLMLPLLIFAGFFLNNDSVPDYFIWIKYLSWFYYSNEAISIELWTNIKTIGCEVSTVTCPNLCRLKSGTDVLAAYSIKSSNFNRNIGLLFVLLIIPRILGYILLRLKVSRL